MKHCFQEILTEEQKTRCDKTIMKSDYKLKFLSNDFFKTLKSILKRSKNISFYFCSDYLQITFQEFCALGDGW
jgi:hypothetical protein